MGIEVRQFSKTKNNLGMSHTQVILEHVPTSSATNVVDECQNGVFLLCE